MIPEPANEGSNPAPPNFEAGYSYSVATKWSLVWQAGHATTRRMRAALQDICQQYWSPIYAYIRRLGNSEQDAEDLTQGFFADLLEKNYLAKADPSRGRLRTFLHNCLSNYLSDRFRYNNAQKRGGGATILSLESAEGIYMREVVDTMSPDVVFERRWAMNVIEKAMAAAQARYERRGNGALFEALRNRLTDGEGLGEGAYDDIAARLNMTEGAVRVAVSRCKTVFQECLFQEVGQTIASSDPEEIRQEITTLLNSL